MLLNLTVEILNENYTHTHKMNQCITILGDDYVIENLDGNFLVHVGSILFRHKHSSNLII